MQNWPNLVFKTRPVQVELAHVCLVSKYQTRSPLSRLASPCCRVLDPSKRDTDRQLEKNMIWISHWEDLLVAVDAVAFVGAESIDASLRTDSNSFTLIHIWTLVDCSQILCLWLSFSQLCFLITLTLLSVVQLKARTTGAVIAFGGVHAQLKFMLSCLHQEIVL